MSKIPPRPPIRGRRPFGADSDRPTREEISVFVSNALEAHAEATARTIEQTFHEFFATAVECGLFVPEGLERLQQKQQAAAAAAAHGGDEATQPVAAGEPGAAPVTIDDPLPQLELVH